MNKTTLRQVIDRILAIIGVAAVLLSVSCRRAPSGGDTPSEDARSPATVEVAEEYEYHLEPIGYVFPSGNTIPNMFNLAGQYPEVCARKRTAASTEVETWEVWRNPDDAKAGRCGWVESENMAFLKGIAYAVTGLKLTEDSIETTDDVVYRPLVCHWPDDIRDRVEAGEYGTLVVEDVSCDWGRVEPDADLMTAEGDSVSLNRPLLSCRITLHVKNTSEEVESLRALELWLAYDDVLLGELTIIDSFEREAGQMEAAIHEEIDVPAGSSIIVRLLNTAAATDDVPDKAEFHLINLNRGWQVPLASPTTGIELPRKTQDQGRR